MYCSKSLFRTCIYRESLLVEFVRWLNNRVAEKLKLEQDCKAYVSNQDKGNNGLMQGGIGSANDVRYSSKDGKS